MKRQFISASIVASLTFVLSVFLATSSYAEPSYKAAKEGKKGGATYQHLTEYTSDLRGTNQFDLQNPIEVEAVIRDVIFPEDMGYAQLRFTLSGGEDRKTEYLADTQLVSVLKRKGIHKGFLKKGARVRLIGWPKTEENETDRYMMVSEIELLDENRVVKLHDKNPRIEAKQQR